MKRSLLLLFWRRRFVLISWPDVCKNINPLRTTHTSPQYNLYILLLDSHDCNIHVHVIYVIRIAPNHFQKSPSSESADYKFACPAQIIRYSLYRIESCVFDQNVVRQTLHRNVSLSVSLGQDFFISSQLGPQTAQKRRWRRIDSARLAREKLSAVNDARAYARPRNLNRPTRHGRLIVLGLL